MLHYFYNPQGARKAVEIALLKQLSLKKQARKDNTVSVQTNINTGSFKKKKDPLDVSIRSNLHRIKRGGGEISSLLYDLLRLQTPYGLESFIERIIIRECNHFKQLVEKDDKGNLHVLVGKREDSDTVFSCHMDTMHTWPRTGYNEPTKGTKEVRSRKEADEIKHCQKQDLFITGSRFPVDKRGIVYAGLIDVTKSGPPIYDPCILGADDKLGVYMCLRLIRDKVPGLYLFHVGEERGCIGSGFIKDNFKSELKTYKRCVAFDRAGFTDVITHQRGRRCASADFGQQMADAINANIPPGVRFTGDVHGVYTDSAEYDNIISECINLSVGYFNQHSSDEHFDHVWLENMLLPGLLKVKWEELKATRDPTEQHVYKPAYTYGKAYERQYNSGVNSEAWKIKPVNKITVALLKYSTPLADVPNYSPLKDGHLKYATAEQMERLIRAWDQRVQLTPRVLEIGNLIQQGSAFDYKVMDLLRWIDDQKWADDTDYDDLPFLLQDWIAHDQVSHRDEDVFTSNEDLDAVPMIDDKGDGKEEVIHYMVKADLTQNLIQTVKKSVKLPDALDTFVVGLKQTFRKGKSEVVDTKEVSNVIDKELDTVLANYIVIGAAFCNGDAELLKSVNRALDYSASTLEAKHTIRLNAELNRIYKDPGYDIALLQGTEASSK